MASSRIVRTLVFAGLVALTACSNSTSTDDGNGSSTTSTTATPAVTPGIETTTSHVPAVSTPASETMAYLTAVRIDPAGNTDRVVFTFEGALPGYTVSYIDGPLLSDGEGAKVDVEGSSIATVVFEQASTAKLTGGYTKTYDGPDRIAGNATRTVREVVKAGDFEAHLTWGIGTSARVPFNVSKSESTSEIIVTFT